MKKKRKVEGRKNVILLSALILVLIILNYRFLDQKLSTFLNEGKTENVLVERVIDGDTIVTKTQEHVRLLGINTPETTSKEFYSAEAKGFLESLVKNQTVTLEFTKDKYDKYNRTLAYVFLNGENVNAKMVENGFANYYFYSGRDIYSDDLINAWKTCIENKVNLCEPSKNRCAQCISIESTNKISNSCDFSCGITDWQIKGEGREKFIFNQTLGANTGTNFALNLENSGGSLYLRDNDGKLVDWKEG